MNIIIEEDCKRILRKVDLTPLKNKSILLTGGTGFVGRYLINLIYLANRDKNLNCSLVATSLHKTPKDLKKLAGKNIRFKKVDLSKPFRISGKFHYIFHAAGYGQPTKFTKEPLKTIFINANATQILLELARKNHAKFIFISSADIYGDVPKNMKVVPETYGGNRSTIGPRAVYGESKRLGETICWAYQDKHNIDVKIVRASHLYGPGISIHDKRVLGDFLRSALKGKSIKLKDRGQAVKTFGYIADVITMIFFVALKGKDMVYNVGGKSTISIRKLAHAVGKLTASPVLMPKRNSSDRHIGTDPRVAPLNLNKITKEMKGFSFTPLGTGLKRTIEWNKEEFHL